MHTYYYLTTNIDTCMHAHTQTYYFTHTHTHIYSHTHLLTLSHKIEHLSSNNAKNLKL